jgi:hypothetical protein
MRVSRIGVVSAVAVLLLGLGGCGGSDDGKSSSGGDPTGSDPTETSTDVLETPLFPDDFEPVCEGATVSAATAYDQAAADHKALYFATYEESLLDQSSRLPADWTVTFAATGNALQAVDLVACAVRTADKLVRTCTGYQDDGVDTGNEVRWHTATYDVSVREATTGTELTSKTIEATDKDCPSFVTFDEGEDSVDRYAEIPDNQVVAVLKPFVQP